MKNSKTPRGPRIRTINIVSVVLTLLIALLFLYGTLRTSQANRDLNESTEKYVVCEMAATTLKQGSDNLTNQVRLYTVTGDPAYLRAYFEEVATQHREQAVETRSGRPYTARVWRPVCRCIRGSTSVPERWPP